MAARDSDPFGEFETYDSRLVLLGTRFEKIVFAALGGNRSGDIRKEVTQKLAERADNNSQLATSTLRILSGERPFVTWGVPFMLAEGFEAQEDWPSTSRRGLGKFSVEERDA